MVEHGIPRYPAESSSISGCDFDSQLGTKHEKLSMSRLSMSIAGVQCNTRAFQQVSDLLAYWYS